MVEGILVPVKGQIKNDSNYELAKVEKSNITPGKETKAPSQACDRSSQVGAPVDQWKKNSATVVWVHQRQM